ncbi:MAG TPA: exosortase H [Cellvibrionaceae bacterium]
MLRFFMIFLAVMAALFTLELLPVGQRYFVQPLTAALADASAFFIALFGRELIVDGDIIIDAATGFAAQIAAGCNGIEAMILLTAAIVAFPAPWRYKLWGIVLGAIGIQALNLVRIVSLFYLGLWHKEAFEWAHLYIWQALIMLDTLLVWMVWIRYLPRQPNNQEPPADAVTA